MATITFEPDKAEVESRKPFETALFLGVRGDPALESTQLRWQVRVAASDTVQLETSATRLETLGGALFLTTKEPKTELAFDDTPPPIGWIKWIAEDGRRSFQVQLAISGVGFDRVVRLAEQGQYPHVVLTFLEDSGVASGSSPDGSKKIWNNLESKRALASEFTLRYDLPLSMPILK